MHATGYLKGVNQVVKFYLLNIIYTAMKTSTNELMGAVTLHNIYVIHDNTQMSIIHM